MAIETKDKQTLKVGETLEFHYQKSPEYRSIHCDGAHGGISPRGYVTFTLYNERNTIPRKSTRQITEVGERHMFGLGIEETKEGLGGIMRQLEVTVFMDLNTAREFWLWFGGKVAELEESSDIPDEQRVVKRQEERRQEEDK